VIRTISTFAASTALLALVMMPSAASATSTSAAAAGPATGQTANGAAATPPKYSWPEFHQNAALTGVNADPSLTASNAGNLGVRWMEPTRAAIFSSPVVAWNANLKKTLVYVVNEAGYVTAFDEASGDVVWSQTFDVPIRATPLVDNGNLWMATDQDSHLYKMNAATGAVECSAVLPLAVESSPVVGTPPGGVRTVYVATNDGGDTNGPVIAVAASNCQVN
jgi:outer membrane protein assembly factor BamB